MSFSDIIVLVQIIMVLRDSKVKYSLSPSATPLCDMDYVANELEASTKVKTPGYTRYLSKY